MGGLASLPTGVGLPLGVVPPGCGLACTGAKLVPGNGCATCPPVSSYLMDGQGSLLVGDPAGFAVNFWKSSAVILAPGKYLKCKTPSECLSRSGDAMLAWSASILC